MTEDNRYPNVLLKATNITLVWKMKMLHVRFPKKIVDEESVRNELIGSRGQNVYHNST